MSRFFGLRRRISTVHPSFPISGNGGHLSERVADLGVPLLFHDVTRNSELRLKQQNHRLPGYLARSDSCDPLSGSPAFTVRDAAALPRPFKILGAFAARCCWEAVRYWWAMSSVTLPN
jgi:hypothetical protein